MKQLHNNQKIDCQSHLTLYNGNCRDAASASMSSSSQQSSPARYKINRQNKKLVTTRSSPQLMLNQIHEEEVRRQDVQSRAKLCLKIPAIVLPGNLASPFTANQPISESSILTT